MESVESDIDNRAMTYADVIKILIAAGNVRAAFINCLDSELLLVTKKGFKVASLDKFRERLPIWMTQSQFPADPNLFYSFTCTKVCRIRTIEIEGSPLRAKLMYPGIDKIL